MVLLQGGQHTAIRSTVDIGLMHVEGHGRKSKGISEPAEHIGPYTINREVEKLKNRNSIALLIAPAASVPQERKERPPHLSALLCEPQRANTLSESETGAGSRVTTPTTPTDEYSSGRVFCDTFGESISVKDDAGFTVEHWQEHRNACRVNQLSPDPPNFSPHHGHRPPATERIRRRAKRTEEERIDYLRSDPFVARFEAYHVLCASCGKWIRLRLNSTYCSIPWDAHRKRCLAGRAAKNFIHLVDDRTTGSPVDPSVEQFAGESSRVQCRSREKWTPSPADDDSSASSPGESISKFDDTKVSPPPQKHLLALALSPSLSPQSTSAPARTTAVAVAQPLLRSSGNVPNGSLTVTATVKDYPSSNYYKSRRHKADQRAAALRADAMVGTVEPDRVFCRLCEKWIRLRQDSTYCTYPWRQHRDKCLLRHQKISDRVAAIAELRAARDAALVDALEVGDSDSRGFAEGGSENRDGADGARGWRAERQRRAQANAAAVSARLRQLDLQLEDSKEAPRHRCVGSVAPGDLEDDDTKCDRMDVDIPAPPLRLAELDSPAGRLDFASRSVQHLFRTAYARSDELTIAALVVYLNAAMPPDKHEDFDTAEVTKMMCALHGRGAVVFEGDVVDIPN